MVAVIDLGQDGMSRCSTVSQVDTPVLFSVFVRGGACLWVRFGLLEEYALWLEYVEVVKDGLEEWEFGGEFGEFGSYAVFDISNGSTVRVDGVILLL